jgi:ABC-type multidrug transport system fused ATPase/permease subunit
VVGFGRVQRVLDAAGEMAYGARRLARTTTGARLEVRGLAYRYAGGPPLLRDVTFRVGPGETVAVVGATASGKSTLTALVLRLVDPDDGQVLLDGVDLRELAPGALAEHAALVPQQAFLFDDTVRGNVTLGADLPDEDVWLALRTAQADGFVAALPDGLDTRLGERGATLSGGQRQRLSLARALVRRPRLLVMDDATSAVDPEVEARILAALRRAPAAERSGVDPDATVLVVAYRKATIALADRVVFLRAGRVEDVGGHDALIARNERYADLVNAYEQDAAGAAPGDQEVGVP